MSLNTQAGASVFYIAFRRLANPTAINRPSVTQHGPRVAQEWPKLGPSLAQASTRHGLGSMYII